MNNIQKIGGYASIIQGIAYIIGFALAFTMLMPVFEYEPQQYIAFLVDNFTLMYVWHLIIYVIAAITLVPLVLAVHDRLKDASPALSQISAVFGLIWAGMVLASGLLILVDLGVVTELYAKDPIQAETVWTALSAVESALGGGIELPGGMWVILLSWAGLRSKGLPMALNILGLIIGIAGIITVIPGFYEGGTVFGLGFILWFLWAGVVLVQGSSNKAVVAS